MNIRIILVLTRQLKLGVGYKFNVFQIEILFLTIAIDLTKKKMKLFSFLNLFKVKNY